MRALVVFNDGNGAQHWLAPLLRTGFRHVFCALADDPYWILIDAAVGVPVVKVVSGTDYDLAAYYRNEGFTVVETEQRQEPVRAPLVAANCVGIVTAALCLRTFAITPWQLYCHLERNSHEATGFRRSEHSQGRDAGSATAAHADPGA